MCDQTLMQKALFYLNKKDYSEARLVSKLADLNTAESEIMAVIARLKDNGYLNDFRYGVNRIRILQKQLKSRAYIWQELSSQGLSRELIEELLEEYYPSEQELVIAQGFLDKKGSNKSLLQKKVLLSRAGFSESIILHFFSDGHGNRTK